jgi:hypothetical protein
MLPRAVTARVAYTPGTAFYADGLGARNMRLSFCFPTPERISEGIKRLGEVIAAEQEIHATFGIESANPTNYRNLAQGPAPDIN